MSTKLPNPGAPIIVNPYVARPAWFNPKACIGLSAREEKLLELHRQVGRANALLQRTAFHLYERHPAAAEKLSAWEGVIAPAGELERLGIDQPSLRATDLAMVWLEDGVWQKGVRCHLLTGGDTCGIIDVAQRCGLSFGEAMPALEAAHRDLVRWETEMSNRLEGGS